MLRLGGRLSDAVQWSLAGLVAEREATSWRMAAEFVMEIDEGHTIEFGSSYGNGLSGPTLPPSEDESGEAHVGDVFLRDSWELSDRLTASVGGRYAYVGYIAHRNYVDPLVSFDWALSERSRLHAKVARRTLAPGGDQFRLAAFGSVPAIAVAALEGRVRSERVTRYELGLSRRAGAFALQAAAFHEQIRDQLVNTFDGPALQRTLSISNGSSDMSYSGLGVTFSSNVGSNLVGSLTYALGVGREGQGAADAAEGHRGPLPAEGHFQDIVARIETMVDRSDTRVLAYYRINRLDAPGEASSVSTRFDVQLNQGLPFINGLTRADWELLFAVKNLFYEEGEGALLDEMAVSNPPKLLVGGIQVRF